MTDDPNSVTVQKSNWTTIVTIASISSVFIIFIAALWGAGFLTFTGSDPSSKIVAAALALVGGLVAAVVSIVGIVLKYSIDQRTETRLQIEASRAAAERKSEADRENALQMQAEQRLNLEAAIRAVELLGSEGNANALQRAGALFALSNLDQHQLTVDLMSYLLDRDDLEPHIACTLIDRAVKRGDEGVKRRAINVFNDNAERMVTAVSTSAPRTITNWDVCLDSTYLREFAIFGMRKILLARPLSEWVQPRFLGHLNATIATFALAWASEPDERVKRNCGLTLKHVLGVFEQGWILFHPKTNIDTAVLTSEVAMLQPSDTVEQEIVKELEAWIVAKSV